MSGNTDAVLSIIGTVLFAAIAVRAEFRPALARMELDRGQILPGETIRATYTAKLTLPTNIVRCGMSTWRKTASPGMTAANCTSAPIQSVTVNGNDWKDFDRAKEVVKLRSVRETAIVEASYK